MARSTCCDALRHRPQPMTAHSPHTHAKDIHHPTTSTGVPLSAGPWCPCQALPPPPAPPAPCRSPLAPDAAVHFPRAVVAQVTMAGQRSRLYIVPGVTEDTVFAPQVRRDVVQQGFPSLHVRAGKCLCWASFVLAACTATCYLPSLYGLPSPLPLLRLM